MTIENLYKEAKYKLQKAGIEDPAFDALCLIEKVFGFNRAMLISNGNKEAAAKEIQEFNALVDMRTDFEPLQYILGSWNFMGYNFKVGRGVLIPREDTCEVVSLCLEKSKNIETPKILDLCAGSGAISVVLSKELKNADVTAVEKSEYAFPYLSENIRQNNCNVKAVKGNIFICFDKFPDNSFDIIISNPPYIKTEEIKTLQPEVKKEPRLALDGGIDGYDFYRSIIKNWTKKLKHGGHMAFELGENQFKTVKALMTDENFINIKEKLDLGGIQRAIIGTLL